MLEVHLATALLSAMLALATFVDLRTMRIPDLLNAILVVAGLGATWFLERPMLASVVGVIVGYAAIFVVNQAYRMARGRDGLGLGDAKLLAAGGVWLGWSGLPFVILIASASALAFVAAAFVAGRRFGAQDALPFGPFLSAGILVVWLVQVYT